MYSMGNIINNFVISIQTYGIRWVLDASKISLHKLYKCFTQYFLNKIKAKNIKNLNKGQEILNTDEYSV